MNWKVSAISCALIVTLAFATNKISRMPFWLCLVLVAVAMLLNGWLAAVEDDWPGGFNNPNPPATNTQRRVARVTEGVLLKLFRRH